MLANVKIEQDKENKHIHRVFVDGEKLKRVNNIDLNIDVNEAPQVNVRIVVGCDFEGIADIHFDYSPHTVKEACKIIRDELLKHGDLYEGFVASIKSSLKDQILTGLPFQTEREIAENILKRIIGED